MIRRSAFPLLAALTLCGCDALPAQTKPADVVKAAFMAASNEDYDKAKGYMVRRDFQLDGHTIPSRYDTINPAFWREFTLGRKIVAIEILKEQSERNLAQVTSRIVYHDKRHIQSVNILVKEDGQWRMMPIIETSKNWPGR